MTVRVDSAWQSVGRENLGRSEFAVDWTRIHHSGTRDARKKSPYQGDQERKELSR